MDLTKSKFTILKTPKIPYVGSDVIEFINFNPDEDHLRQLGSGQYLTEEGAVFLADSEDDLEEYEDIMSNVDSSNPIELENAHKSLEAKGYIKVGDSTICDILKRDFREDEYILVLDINELTMVVIASSSNKRLLQDYKKLIDNKITRFKLSLILNTYPERVISKEDYKYGILEEIEAMEEELAKLNL
jgi:hypothetical protein